MSLPALTRPSLVNPLVYTLPATGYADTDQVTVNVPSGHDFIIKSPRLKRYGHLIIKGGRNGILAGGHLTIGKNRDGSYPTNGYRGVGDQNIEILNGDAGSTVHIEGLLIDSSGGAESDGFMLNCGSRIVQVQWCHIAELLGSKDTGHRHADVCQIGPGGVGELRVDHVTGRSHYNTFYCRRENSPLGAAHGPLKFRYSNTGGYTTNPVGSPQGTLTGVSLGTQPADSDGGPSNNASATNADLPGDVYFDHFYAAPLEAGHPNLGEFLHPDARKNSYGPAKPISDGKGGWYWPCWRGTSPGVHGRIIEGPPPNGDWCPASKVGLAYAAGVYA